MNCKCFKNLSNVHFSTLLISNKTLSSCLLTALLVKVKLNFKFTNARALFLRWETNSKRTTLGWFEPVSALSDCQVRLATQRTGSRMAYHAAEPARDRWKKQACVPPPLSPCLYLVLMQHILPAMKLTSMYFQVSGATKPPCAGYRPNHTVMRKDKHISERLH